MHLYVSKKFNNNIPRNEFWRIVNYKRNFVNVYNVKYVRASILPLYEKGNKKNFTAAVLVLTHPGGHKELIYYYVRNGSDTRDVSDGYTRYFSFISPIDKRDKQYQMLPPRLKKWLEK